MQDGRNRCVESSDLMRECQQHFSEQEEARDPDPDVETRQDFWSLMGNNIYRNHVALRPKLYAPKGDFPMLLNYFVQRQANTSIGVLHEATIDDYWNLDGERSRSEFWICLPRFALFKKYIRRTCVVPRLTDEETGYYTTTQIHKKDACGFKAD